MVAHVIDFTILFVFIQHQMTNLCNALRIFCLRFSRSYIRFPLCVCVQAWGFFFREAGLFMIIHYENLVAFGNKSIGLSLWTFAFIWILFEVRVLNIE